MTFAVITALGLAGAPCCQVQPPEFTRAKIDSTLGGWHATTRGTVRLVFVHRGRWLVFRGGPNAYHFSSDGVTWTYTEAQQASRSHFIDGDSIYTQYSVDMDPAPDKWDFKHYACVGTIGEEAIAWGEPAELPLRLTYYPDTQRDTAGRFTMTGRAVLRDEAGEMAGEEILWARTQEPGDFLNWGTEVRCCQHRRRRASWDDCLEWLVAAHATRVLENDLAQRCAKRQLIVAALADVAADAEQLCARASRST